MKKAILILMLFVISASFAALCSPGFSEDITVQVLDGKLRPVENAKVNFTFQVSYSTGKGYFTTPYFYTNSGGTTSYLVTNQEPTTEHVDCNIVLRAMYGSATAQKTIVAENHENLVQVKLDIYGVTIKVVDQNEKPLAGAEVWIDSITETTNAQGIVFFMVKSGTSKVYVKYADGKFEDEVVVEDDTVKKIGVGLYPFSLTVRDDKGNKLNAIATVGNQTHPVINGTLALEKLATARPHVIARYQNMEKEVDVDLTIKNDYQVFFDLTNPSIVNVSEPEFGSDAIKITIIAEDPGQFSSGMAQGGVKLDYEVNRSKEWVGASVYQQKKGVFIAEIPLQAPDTRIDFMIEAKDKEGNGATVEGWFLAQQQQQQQNQTNQTNGQPPPSDNKEGGFPWLAVGGLLIVVVAIVLYFKYKGGDSTEG